MTGRTHQLRVHCQHAGATILGDRSYGGLRRITQANGALIPIRQLMLHAYMVDVPETSVRVVAEPPAPFVNLLQPLKLSISQG